VIKSNTRLTGEIAKDKQEPSHPSLIVLAIYGVLHCTPALITSPRNQRKARKKILLQRKARKFKEKHQSWLHACSHFKDHGISN
jgi:hypothetical protein